MRYIGKTFFIWTHGEDKLYKFPENLNSFHVNLKFTSSVLGKKLLKLNNNQFAADLYCKLANCNQHLHHKSCHPEHMKKSSVYSQRRRTKNLCSEETSLTNILRNLRSWFCNRGYPEIMVEENLRRVENRNRDELLFADSCR